MSILLDMDGVLVDLVGGLVRRFKLGQGVRSYIRKRFGEALLSPDDFGPCPLEYQLQHLLGR